MIRTSGEICLYIALVAASLQCILPLLGSRKKNIYLLACAPTFSLCQFLFVTFAYVLLTIAFATNDFSIAYVAANSHADLPWLYKLTAVWGAHEGSVLLWILLLSLWTIHFSNFQKNYANYHFVLAILGAISFCFLTFVCFTSNPFAPALIQNGQDLNPLLQDPGFVIHPPMLYLGYVGMSVPFALTLVALIKGELNQTWAKLTRYYTIASWSFLTLGITLGSWWAYRVLGWGGFWFWDPVENASLLPWLCSVALIHILIVVDKRNVCQTWAALLAIISFTLSVLGTFLVRSGILVSAHTFANDPARGVFLLMMLAIITCFAIFFYIKHYMQSTRNSSLPFNLLSRETSLIINTILICTALTTILIGTLYPLIMDALQLGSISVGAPYFNKVLLPLVFIILFAMGFSVYLKWEKDDIYVLIKTISKNLLLSITIAMVVTLLIENQLTFITTLTLALSFWVLISVFEQKRTSTGMMIAHAGFAILMIGIILSSVLSIDKEVSIRPGNAVRLGPYQFFFINASTITGPNYRAIRAAFEVLKEKHHVVNLYPEKRIYTTREMVMTNVDIHPSIFRDLYIALGQPLDHDYWSVKIYYKPFMRWIWAGGVIMMLGGILIIWRRRYLI